MTKAAPGTAQNMYLVVADIEAARADLAAHGAEVSDVFHPAAPGGQFSADPESHLVGAADERATYGSFATFSDPDGNVWLLQEVTARLPGRIDADGTSFAVVLAPLTVGTLADATSLTAALGVVPVALAFAAAGLVLVRRASPALA